MSTTTTTPAPLNVRLTKTAAVGLLGAIGFALATYAKANLGTTVDATIIAAAIGDTITFLQGTTLSDTWKYASVNLLLSAILATVGMFIGQVLGPNSAYPVAGTILGYFIAYGITLLEPAPASTTPAAPPTPAPSTPPTPATTTA